MRSARGSWSALRSAKVMARMTLSTSRDEAWLSRFQDQLADRIEAEGVALRSVFGQQAVSDDGEKRVGL
jgi:hypothetical protein